MAGMRAWVRLVVALLLFTYLAPGPVLGQTTRRRELPLPLQPPAVLNKIAPENVDELRAMERHVQKVLAKVMPSVVGVLIGTNQGSGVIVKEDGTLLTA